MQSPQPALLAYLKGHRHVSAKQQSSLQLLSETLPALQQHCSCLQDTLQNLSQQSHDLTEAAGTSCSCMLAGSDAVGVLAPWTAFNHNTAQQKGMCA